MSMLSLEQLFSLKGKTALVTGGSAGLGRMCAQALLVAGARVLVVSRKADNCIAVARDLSEFGPCEGFGGTVGSTEDIEALAAELRQRTDRLDILVNNAGATWGAPFEQFDRAAWDKVLSVNLVGLFDLTRVLMPMLLDSGRAGDPARIVNMGSTVGTIPLGQNAYSYAASKAAVHHLTRILSNEFAARNVNINAIAPGPFETRMSAFALSREDARRAALNAVPMHRFGQLTDIAGALIYLCGLGGAYTTGAILPVDGGMASDAIGSMWEE